MNGSLIQSRKLSDIVFREDLYPRIKHDSSLVQRYADNIELLPPIEVNQNNILIDGFHRWTAHRKLEREEIKVTVTETPSENELFALSIERNSKHGLQLNEEDKKNTAIRLYSGGAGLEKQRISKVLSVSLRQINNYLTTIDKNLKEQRDKTILEMWMACRTQEEIAAAVDLSKMEVSRVCDGLCNNLEAFPKSYKLLATFQDEQFTTPLYNVWKWNSCTNETNHFGKSEQTIVDNLLYLYTNPFDIVVDPFAGGGSTVDICKKRLRRYWVSDRKPIPEREKEIRQFDITSGVPPLNRNWSEVSLTYLDPPYWKQAEGKYSNDASDLANMSRDEFTSTLSGLIKEISKRQSKGAIALLIQPTQWKSPNKEFSDHIFDIISAVGNKKLAVENRVSCPYTSEQYTPQQVEYAKREKKLLVLTRELIVWRAGV